MNMKILRTSFCVALAALMFSCSSEEPAPIPNLQPKLPGSTENHVKSITHSGNIEGCYDWNFTYKDSRLTSATGTLYNPTTVAIQYTSNLLYSPDTIGIKNTGDLAMKVVLNSDNCIEYLLVNKDEYRFVYSEGRLVSWNKTIKDLNFGAEALHAYGSIEYNEGDIATITYAENNDDPTYYRCAPTAIYNTDGLLPETLSKQMGCFGFEHLYYAGLLGKATKHLVKSVQIDYPDEAKKDDYSVEFRYSTNKSDQIELCTFILNDEAVSVNYVY